MATTTLGVINDTKRPSSIHAGGGKDMIAPDYPSHRPKSTTSLGNGSVSRTDGSNEFSVGGACYRYTSTDNSENVNNKHITSIPGMSSSSRHNVMESRDPLSTVVGTCLAGSSNSFAPPKPGSDRKPSSSSTASQSNPKADGSESILIEERRRKSGGEGYTTHQYMRGRLLGKGGFAKVYLCTAMETGKHYAMKIVPKANLVKERARQKVR